MRLNSAKSVRRNARRLKRAGKQSMIPNTPSSRAERISRLGKRIGPRIVSGSPPLLAREIEMPIRPENKARYPKDWKAISARIRFERAGGRCECTGQCGLSHEGRCDAWHGDDHPQTGSKVVLTVMHMDHQPENNDDANLMAGCQRCHNRYDAPMRRAGINERAKLALGMVDMFPPTGKE